MRIFPRRKPVSLKSNMIVRYIIFRPVKEKPCEEEMQLFSTCLVDGEQCEEFEEKYFKCMENAKA